MKIKKCTVCGQEFKSYNGREVCSDECFQKRKHEMESEANYRRRKGLSCTPITYTCPVCGKEFENFGFKEFSQCPKTTLFGNFETRTFDGKIQIVNRLINKPVCSEECKKRNEDKYLVEEYKGNKIYCVNGKYIPYFECGYWYNSIEDIKEKIDNTHLKG